MVALLSTLGFFAALGIVLIGLFILGFQVPPRAPRRHLERTGNLDYVTIPDNLPPPVRRYYDVIAKAGLPDVRTAVAWGRAKLQLRIGNFRIWVPLVFREQFIAGQGFYWSATVRWFGLPFGKGYDYYKDGEGRFAFGKAIASGPQTDQAENLRLWTESVWLPSAWLTDPRVHWEPGDESTAYLVVPFEETEERIEVQFAPETGLMTEVRVRRYRGMLDARTTPWAGRFDEWGEFHGILIPRTLRPMWDRNIYGELRLDGIEYNVLIEELGTGVEPK